MIRVGGWAEPLTDYFSREISWLAFNARVLALADDADVPLLEQARYLSIFATNLDEFFQVRVSGLADRVAAELTERTLDGHTPAEQLREVRRIAAELCAEQQRLFIEKVRPALAAEGIHLLTPDEISPDECAYLRDHFEERVFPVLTPLAVDPGHPFPFISDLSLSLAVLMRDPVASEQRFARVKVPDTLDRWVETGEGSCRFVALEDVIAAHLDKLFPGMEVLEHHSFRVTRNADLTLNDEDADDLLIAVQMELRRRRFQWAVRLEVADTMSDEVLDLLLRELNLRAEALVRVRGPIDLSGLNKIADLPRPELTWPHWRGITEPELVTEDGPADFFKVLRSGDLLVHHPYSSFSRSVGALIRQAARDPAVLAIKLTLYRTSGDSPIIDALVAAAERGKQVAVLVELKARFDEAQNISWAKRLEQAGAHVAYGLVGLKIHAKIAMIVREEPDGIRRYCHVGTGNYNHRTARIYEDFGLLTANPGGRRGRRQPVQPAHRLRPQCRAQAPDHRARAAPPPPDRADRAGDARARRPHHHEAQLAGRRPDDRPALQGVAGRRGDRPDRAGPVRPAARRGRPVRDDTGALDSGPVPGALPHLPLRQRRRSGPSRHLHRLRRPADPQPRPEG